MKFQTLRHCLTELTKSKHCVRVDEMMDPDLEMAALHRRVFQAGGPALWFTKVKGSPFEAASNIYGSKDRMEFLFGDALKKIQSMFSIMQDPVAAIKSPLKALSLLPTALHALPKKVRSGPILKHTTQLSKLPLIKSWPEDGGPFITMPQVTTLPPHSSNIFKSNTGMYRIQLQGNAYQTDIEAGLHYQIHRGIGNHHTAYKAINKPFQVAIWVGGPPALSVAAIMPLPEDIPEVSMAGVLQGRRFPYVNHDGYLIARDADFCITGIVDVHALKPEGPFGDHLGYYSLEHPFPYLKITGVYHRPDPIWHFTVVGRPPQEDSYFGSFIHSLVGNLIAHEFPGVRELHAVDCAGVHPLLLAIGSERYMPFREKRPEEIITQACHILGKGQTSLAKHLFITEGGNEINTKDISKFFTYFFERFDPEKDLHFITNTTIDTLDYSGQGWNAGSKCIWAAAGSKKFLCASELASNWRFPPSVRNSKLASPGILVVEGSPYQSPMDPYLEELLACWNQFPPEGIRLCVLADDAEFTAKNLCNFCWVTFTRSDPAADIHGPHARYHNKHWGSSAPILIDARKKPHHAPELIPDPVVEQKINRFFQRGGLFYHLEK